MDSESCSHAADTGLIAPPLFVFLLAAGAGVEQAGIDAGRSVRRVEGLVGVLGAAPEEKLVDVREPMEEVRVPHFAWGPSDMRGVVACWRPGRRGKTVGVTHMIPDPVARTRAWTQRALE